jgi:epoxyqueuosine reductase
VTVSEEIKREAVALGFQAVGISRVEDGTDERATRLGEWLARGYHGLMTWMARDPERRADPRKVLPGCRSIISVGMNYFTGHRADERPGNGRIARYAWGEDYHKVLLGRLEQLATRIEAFVPGSACRCYVDTGPVMEKSWAQKGGLGWIGKHSNLVSPEYGSWLLLGEILTTVPLEPDMPGADLCGTCTLCIRACPTAAITEPYVVDSRRCISYLTIELREADQTIPEEMTRQMGNRIFGCDDCLDVCPYNVNASPTSEPDFQPRSVSLAPELDSFHQMDQATFLTTFRGSAIQRSRHGGLLRNIRTAINNWQATLQQAKGR